MTSVTNVDYLFDRLLELRHPWRDSLARLNSELGNNLRATSANLRMDWRVSAAAEGKLTDAPDFNGSKLAAGLDSALGAYFLSHYCQSARAVTFVDPADIHIPGHQRLIHVAVLDRLIRRIWRRDDLRAILIQEIRSVLGEAVLVSGISPGEPDDSSLDHLATRLNRAGESAVRSIVDAVHDLLGPGQPHWWAVFHGEVGEYLQDGRRLVNALGLGDLSDGVWLVVYGYTVADAGLLYRPTVVEANRYAFHFVSPPGLKTGLTMPIDPVLPPCAEVLHYPLAPDAAARACSGQLLRIGTARRDANDDQDRYAGLDAIRAAQRQRIRKRYVAAHEWLGRHQAAF